MTHIWAVAPAPRFPGPAMHELFFSSLCYNSSMLRTINATRYVTPLREGGSLPAIMEADDDGLYVIKFRGAGQGLKALIAELVAGEIARALGLPVPEIVFMELDPVLGCSEPDFEIQDLIKAVQVSILPSIFFLEHWPLMPWTRSV